MKICVVEDVISMRNALRRVLMSMPDTEVFDFSSAAEAIRFLDGHFVDVVISDIYLQKDSGYDVLSYLRSRAVCSDIPVIFVTGEGTKDDIVHSSEVGVNDYVLKPFESQELINKVNRVLEKFDNPSRVDRIMRNAEKELEKGDFDEARSHFLSAKAKEFLPPRAAVGVARIDILQGNPESALKRLEHTIKESSLFFPAFSLLVDLCLDLGKTKEATDYLFAELAINGKQPHRRMLLADLLMETGHTEDALTQMRQAIVDTPKDERLLLKMARLYEAIGDHERALHYFLKTRRTFANSRGALQGILDICKTGDDLKKAVQLFGDQLTSNKTRVEVYLYRAKAYDLQEEYSKALGDLDTFLLSTGPDDQVELDALRFKAKVLGKLKRFSEQGEIYGEIAALTMAPEFEAKAGLAYIKAEKYTEAAKHYKLAVKAEPRHPKYRFNLAYAYERMGQIDKAISLLQTVLKLQPGHQDSLDFMERLKASQATDQAKSAS